MVLIFGIGKSPSRRNESSSSDEPKKVTPTRKRSLQRLNDILLRKLEAPPKETRHREHREKITLENSKYFDAEAL